MLEPILHWEVRGERQKWQAALVDKAEQYVLTGTASARKQGKNLNPGESESKSNSRTPTGYVTPQFKSDTSYLELAQVKGKVSILTLATRELASYPTG